MQVVSRMLVARGQPEASDLAGLFQRIVDTIVREEEAGTSS
jgi:hypothetical protein